MTDTFFNLDEEPRRQLFGLPEHLRHSKKGHRILKNGMAGLQIMQSWVKSSQVFKLCHSGFLTRFSNRQKFRVKILPIH